MSADLRASLWNTLHYTVFDSPGFMFDKYNGVGGVKSFARRLWFDYYKKPFSDIPGHPNEILRLIQTRYEGSRWYEVYDFLEAILSFHDNQELRLAITQVLKRECAGYALVADQFVPVTSELEAATIAEAMSGDRFAPVQTHLDQALRHLSNRDNPDYRNSIKESISAVESISKMISGSPKGTLDDALKALPAALHPAIKSAFTKLYGYTSSADGIRHALMEQAEVSLADARYFLVSCSAFVNYLKSKLPLSEP